MKRLRGWGDKEIERLRRTKRLRRLRVRRTQEMK